MTGQIVLVAGHNSQARAAVSQVIARENRWPLLDVDTLSASLVDALSSALQDTCREPVVAPAQLNALIATMWAQVDSDIDAVVLSAPFVEQLADPDWLNELNYDLALRGYEATVVYLLSRGERHYLAPEHFLLDADTATDALFASAAGVARELR